MVGWHHQINGHKFEQASGDGEGQGSLVCCSPWGCQQSDVNQQLLLLLLLSSVSRVRLCATPQTAAHQAPLSLGFSREEHWSGLPFPSPMYESESEVAQSCPTLSDPMDCSLPGSSIHGIFQARVRVGCHCLVYQFMEILHVFVYYFCIPHFTVLFNEFQLFFWWHLQDFLCIVSCQLQTVIVLLLLHFRFSFFFLSHCYRQDFQYYFE